MFVDDLVNRRFSLGKSQYDGILPEKLMMNAIARGAYGNRAEDEARLFYTAITRVERLRGRNAEIIDDKKAWNKHCLPEAS